MYFKTIIYTDSSKVPIQLLLGINEDHEHAKPGHVDQATCQKCLAFQAGRLCAWAHVPLCQENVGPGGKSSCYTDEFGDNIFANWASQAIANICSLQQLYNMESR